MSSNGVPVRYQIGISEEQRRAAAALYDEAFVAKLGPAIRDDAARLAVLADGFDPEKSVAALAGDVLLGIAGFHDDGGALTGGITFGSIRRRIGFLRSVRAILVLLLLERKPAYDELLMDGIVVHRDARGQGVGTRLFGQLEAHARHIGKTSIRLDVVDTNPAARRLYERLGFVAVKTERTPYLRRVMGFAASTTMVKRLS